MKQVMVIAGREARAYFTSPVGFTVIAGFFLLSALMFRLSIVQAIQSQDVRAIQMFWGNVMIIFVIILPALSMRLVSEEKRSGSIELLMTSPVTEAQAIIGKYLGVLSFLAVMLVMALQFPLTQALGGNIAKLEEGATFAQRMPLYAAPLGMLALTLTIVSFVVAALNPRKPLALYIGFGFLVLSLVFTFVAVRPLNDAAGIWTRMMGLFLLCSAFLAIGTLASTLTRNQVVAYVVTFAVLLLLWMLGWGAEEGTVWGEIMLHLSLAEHTRRFIEGRIDTRSLLLFISVIGACLYLAVRGLAASKSA